MAKYGQICIFGAYLGAPNMVKWGVPEKILQNAVQRRWSFRSIGPFSQKLWPNKLFGGSVGEWVIRSFQPLKCFTNLIFADAPAFRSGQCWTGEMVKQGPQDQHSLGSDCHPSGWANLVSPTIPLIWVLSLSFGNWFDLNFKFSEDGQYSGQWTAYMKAGACQLFSPLESDTLLSWSGVELNMC